MAADNNNTSNNMKWQKYTCLEGRWPVIFIAVVSLKAFDVSNAYQYDITNVIDGLS